MSLRVTIDRFRPLLKFPEGSIKIPYAPPLNLHRSYPPKIFLLLSQRLPQLRNKALSVIRASEDHHHHGSLVSLLRSDHHNFFGSNVSFQPVAVVLIAIIAAVEIAVIAGVAAAA